MCILLGWMQQRFRLCMSHGTQRMSHGTQRMSHGTQRMSRVTHGAMCILIGWMQRLFRLWMSHGTPRMHVSRHTYEWVMSHIRMSHGTHMNESCHIYEWVMSHAWMIHVTQMNESCHTYDWVMSYLTYLSDMGWLRLEGSSKLQVSFAKEPYKRDYIVQKRPIILGSLLIVATPYYIDECVTHMNESCHTCGVAMISRLLKKI